MIPLHDNVLCTDVQTEESNGCIILVADRRKELSKEQAMVLALGPECSGAVKVGDRVIHRAHARWEGPTEDTFLLRESDIVARINE